MVNHSGSQSGGQLRGESVRVVEGSVDVDRSAVRNGGDERVRMLRPVDGAMSGAPAVFARLTAYWQGLREGGALPARAAILPRDIAPFIDRAFLVERIAPGHARFRLAGMALADLMGMDLRGMPVSALILPARRGAFAAALEQVFTGPEIAHLSMEAERGIGRPALAARMLLLPLTGHAGLADRALGVLVCEGRIGQAPRRFAPVAVTHEKIAGLVPTEPQPGPRRHTPDAAVGGFAEAPAGFRPAGRPRLRLIRGRD